MSYLTTSLTIDSGNRLLIIFQRQTMFTRRKLFQNAPLLLAALAAQSGADGAAAAPPAAASSAAGQETLHSFATPFARLPVRRSGRNRFRPILKGITQAGCPLEVHETTLAAGAIPHPPHHHVHEELFLIEKGTVTVTISGRSTMLGPGSAAFVRTGETHGIRNTGRAAALYFVVAIGRERG